MLTNMNSSFYEKGILVTSRYNIMILFFKQNFWLDGFAIASFFLSNLMDN